MSDQLIYLRYDQSIHKIEIKSQDIIDYPNGKKRRKIYQNIHYDQQQQIQIEQFKKYAKDLVDFNIVQDKTILRYLYATQFVFKQCLDKINIFLQWYSNPKIQKFDKKTEDLINQGVIYTYGRDQSFKPIIYLNVYLINMNNYTLQDYLSAINTIITVVIQYLFIKGKVESYIFVIDTGNKNFTSLPLSTVREMILKLSYVYSMRMSKLLIINCNYWIKLMHSAINPFLAQVTQKKISLLSYQEVLQGKMKQHININELQQKYGGFRQNLNIKWPPSVPGKQRKAKSLKQFNFDNQIQKLDNRSEYYSVQNNSELFQTMDQLMYEKKIQATCCQNQQCSIF